MKTAWFCLLVLAFCNVFAQAENEGNNDRITVTVGLLQGGGSLVGADLEVMATQRIGLQIGAGFRGYGAALHYHLKPGPRSSALSLAYWHQGTGDYFTQSLVGGTFVFRAKKLFTAQLGIGARLVEGPALPENLAEVPVILMYSIGIYLCP